MASESAEKLQRSAIHVDLCSHETVVFTHNNLAFMAEGLQKKHTKKLNDGRKPENIMFVVCH